MEINPQNTQAMVNFLQQTLSPDLKTNQAATQFLNSVENKQGFSLLLLHVLREKSIPFPVRQSGAVYFKNFIMRNWVPDEGNNDIITEQDRASIKTHVVNLMLTVPKLLQSQLSQALAIVCEADFPAKWPGLLVSLIQHLNTDDFSVINGVLETLHSMFYRYRHTSKSQTLWEEIKYVLEKFQAPMLSLFQKICGAMQNCQNDRERLPAVVKSLQLISEVFLSLNHQDLPAFFEDHINDYFGPFQQLLAYNNPILDPSDPEEPGVLEETKTSICKCIELYTNKYEEEFKDWVPKFVQTVSHILVTQLSDCARFDPVVTASVKFLTSVVKKAWHAQLFNNAETLNTICDKVVIPQIKLREADIELFSMDGLEYVRRDIEGSDVDTRRRTTIDFVRGLRVHFNEQISTILKQHAERLLAEYAKNPQQNWVAKDAAMYIIYALSVEGQTEQKGVTKVNSTIDILDFFGSQVLPELQSQNIDDLPILKADCLKFLAAFRQQLPQGSYVTLIPLISRYLASEEYVVHTYACYGVERLLSVKVNGGPRLDSKALSPMLQPLLTALFAVQQQEESKENEYVIKAIMRTCAVAKASMSPFVSVLIQKVTSILSWVSQNPRNPRFNHYLFETLACLITYIANAQTIGNFEEALFPPFQQMLGMETCQEFGPYVFQILSQLLSLRSDVSSPYAQIFPNLLVPVLWENKGNVPALTSLLCQFMKKGFQIPDQKMTGILGIFQSMNAKTSQDHFGMQLLGAVVMFLPLQNYQQYLQPIFNFQFARLRSKYTLKYCKALLVFWNKFIIKHGSAALMGVMAQIQANIFGMVLDKFWIPNVQKVSNPVERKICAVGMIKLLCTPSDFLSNQAYSNHWSQVLVSLVKCLELPALKSKEDVDVMDQSSKGFNTAYAKLVFAAPTPDDPCADAGDLRKMLAQGLAQISSASPGKFGPVLGSLPQDFQGKIQQYLQSAGVTIS